MASGKKHIFFGKLDENRAIEFVRTVLIEVALKHGMTARDASYVVLAKKNNLVLITEDDLLMKKTNRMVEVVSLKEII
ncbi:MAG: hypothetical protein QXK89_03665 [Candidatus Bathyarchaeia archaeon]